MSRSQGFELGGGKINPVKGLACEANPCHVLGHLGPARPLPMPERGEAILPSALSGPRRPLRGPPSPWLGVGEEGMVFVDGLVG